MTAGGRMIEMEHNPEYALNAVTHLFWGMSIDDFREIGEQHYAQLMGWA